MAPEEQILELVGLVYDAAGNPSLWPAFLERLADVIDGEGTVLFAVEPQDSLRTVSSFDAF